MISCRNYDWRRQRRLSALLRNSPAQANSLLRNLGQVAVGGIGLYLNAKKTELTSFKQVGAISTLSDKPLELVDQFIYLCSNISLTESVNIRRVMMWTGIGRLSIIWKSDLFAKIKRDFFLAVAASILFYGCYMWALAKRPEKRLDENFPRIVCTVLKKSFK